MKEFVDDAKANPGKFNLAHTGAGGLPHLTAELFKASAGVDLVGVPYKSGGEAVTALLGEQVHVTFEAISILLPLIREGKVRALAITSRNRTPLASDMPTMIEAGVPDYEVLDLLGRGRARRHAARRSSRSSTPRSTRASPPRRCATTITKLGSVLDARQRRRASGRSWRRRRAKWNEVARKREHQGGVSAYFSSTFGQFLFAFVMWPGMSFSQFFCTPAS